jgi:hypothetical protein
MKKLIFINFFIVFFSTIIMGQTIPADSLSYLNQEPPGLTPKVFAPDIISTDSEYEFGSAFSKEADEFYYSVKLDDNWKAEIRYTKLQDGTWTKPVKLELNDKYSYNDPFISKNEDKLYFISNRAINEPGSAKNSDLWYIQKTGKTWSEPVSVGEAINSEKDEYYISFSDTGTIYFASNVHTSDENMWDFDIYYSELGDDKFKVPVNMGDSVNTKYFECDPFVAPDEKDIIFCSSRPDGYGDGDLYISFKNDENKWSKAINMGEKINTETHEFCPFVTKDGKYLFYTSNGNIYWVNAKIVDIIRGKYSK